MELQSPNSIVGRTLVLLGLLCFSPNTLFTQLRDNPNWWIPFLILFVLGTPALVTAIYVHGINSFGSGFLATLFVAINMLFLLNLILLAGYFHYTSLNRTEFVSYKHWFSMVLWANMPATIALICFFTGDRLQDHPLWEAALSIAWWMYRDELQDGWKAVYMIDIPMVLTVILLVIGYRKFTKRSIATATTIVLIPFVVYLTAMYAFFS